MKVLKAILNWIKEATKETINQLFTLLGFFSAWIVLTDEAKTVVGLATIWVFVIWILTISLRGKD